MFCSREESTYYEIWSVLVHNYAIWAHDCTSHLSVIDRISII